MDVVGEFHKEKKLFLVYHHPKYHPVPQIQRPSSSGEKSINKQPIFLCPNARSNLAEAKSRRDSPYFYEDNFPLISSPEYLFSRKSYYNHSVLPLFWCNNKEFDADDGGCRACKYHDFGSGYYFCNLSHNDCMNFPRIIKISRHPHRIFHTSSLPSGEWSCGVCRKNIDGDYGAYTCDKCCDYVVHSICALGKYEWDGKDLENVSEEDDITPDVGPFDMISEGKILHFLHVHHLYLQVSIAYDENKFCQACILPIFEGNFYSCIECDFILHETCAKSHRKIQHALHPHLLTLKLMSLYESNLLMCDACGRFSGGFVYACDLEECHFNLDILCASISEPLDYQDHQHPLYVASEKKYNPMCSVCFRMCGRHLNCITCRFDICFICITLPSIISYKHDKHVLKAMLEKPESRESWCEVCEHYLRDIDTCVVYGCDECCTTFHVECLFGHDPYVRFGQQCEVDGTKFQVLRKSNTSRPFCNSCKQRCQHKIFKRHNFIACSVRCVLRNL
ncbi:hypothetical protein Bca52824_045181 [Brassica carinata]|uniref:Cysteine/Histidine-rich C1 domain family protein n=1 Tax=Brassica carinata TaxID=52824 RepID=A0A8X7RCJ9_BRACI|nr:hypothetical protein Bca52824_045181 [Brassica carinata]